MKKKIKCEELGDSLILTVCQTRDTINKNIISRYEWCLENPGRLEDTYKTFSDLRKEGISSVRALNRLLFESDLIDANEWARLDTEAINKYYALELEYFHKYCDIVDSLYD